MADNNKVFSMPFGKVYPLLVAKVQKKGRTKEELYALTAWMTGYSSEEIESLLLSDMTYGDFFLKAPSMNPLRFGVRGPICGVKIEQIDDPLMRDIRILDKLADDLSKGKSPEAILAKYTA